MEDPGEAVHALLEERFQRLRGHVAPREARSARGDHDIDGRVGDPGLDFPPDRLAIVRHDIAAGQPVPGGRDALDQHVA